MERLHLDLICLSMPFFNHNKILKNLICPSFSVIKVLKRKWYNGVSKGKGKFIKTCFIFIFYLKKLFLHLLIVPIYFEMYKY